MINDNLYSLNKKTNMTAKLILLSTSGKLKNQVDLEMLSFSVHHDKNIFKFVGYGEISFSQIKEYKSKSFYNQCSFFFGQSRSIKIYHNGSYHTSGFSSIESATDSVQYVVDNYINKTKCIIDENNNLKIIYDESDNCILTTNINLIHYLVKIDRDRFEFSKYCICHLAENLTEEDKLKYKIIITKDIFKYASVCVTIENIGDINFFKSSITIPCKSIQTFNILHGFLVKYINILIIPANPKLDLIRECITFRDNQVGAIKKKQMSKENHRPLFDLV